MREPRQRYNPKPKKCQSCRFKATDPNYICDYLLIKAAEGEVGSNRRGCPIGEKCTKYEPGHRNQRALLRSPVSENPMPKEKVTPKLTLEDKIERVKKFHAQGMKDWEIAQRISGVNTADVKHWRELYGLPNNGRPRVGSPPKFDEVKALELYQQGLTDGKIAKALGVVKERTIRNWRHKKGLPGHKKEYPKKKQEPEKEKRVYYLVIDEEKALELWKQKKNDGEIAEIIGCSRAYIQRWRTSKKLLPWVQGKEGKPVPRLDYNRVRELYEQSCTDREIGNLIDCDENRIRRWRKRYGFPMVSRQKAAERERRKFDAIQMRDELDKQAMELFMAGKTADEIAEIMGTKKTWVYQWKKRYSLIERPHKPHKKRTSAMDVGSSQKSEEQEIEISTSDA